ncbi:amidinotransferase [Epibacterium sp. SM1979]|uniref:Amidinotransferase n=1 Tax=Tritonibacter litoralis TaxID=2662264 RepID=A0A843YB00_9RHOB|nr:arginine deiminase-related protein [Tritonibacter litoralis]MQQ07058.1 amidinotransferase [Tritonibacter litoralis]
MTSLQSPSDLVMIRPHHFVSNPETCADNAFQTRPNLDEGAVADSALREFDSTVETLRSAGVSVLVFDDDTPGTPDSVFPNNWFSTHAGGHIAVYPMFAENRRRERRWDVIEALKQRYRVQDVIDYSGMEQDDLWLEGTGAMVLDHIGRVAYVAKSNRADPVLLERFCTHFNFEPMAFDAKDSQGRDVYHTNVLMSVATRFALICLDMIVDPTRRDQVVQRLEETGRTVIDLSEAQINAFAGNALELSVSDGRILALSETALAALSKGQMAQIEDSAALLPLRIPTIETAGGSVRCMMAGIHLSPRKV